MWPIVVRDEQRMYFLTNSHIELLNLESSVELKITKKYTRTEMSLRKKAFFRNVIA